MSPLATVDALLGSRPREPDARPYGIHTICYMPGMDAAVDPAFLPLDVTSTPMPERRETAHMLNFWHRGLHRNYRASALLSPNFQHKTGFDGQLFINFIANNPTFDVWFVNPFPASGYLSYNIWEHGEAFYPGLCERAGRVFRAAGIPADPANFPRSTAATLLFCNYWAGTERFWDQFMPFVARVTAAAEQFADINDQLPYASAPNTTFWPFIFERLFTTFLMLNPGIRARYVQYGLPHLLQMATCRTEALLLRDWVPMIDRWDCVGVYSDDQRQIFRNLHRLLILAQFEKAPKYQEFYLGL